jgi:ATP/maltotriose-dependent transcriptional regulator MalT
MIVGTYDRPRALAILDRAVTLGRETGQSFTETWALTMMCFAHLYGGAIDEAERRTEEFRRLAERQRNDEGLAYVHALSARVSLARGDLTRARSQFADAAALARARSAAWPHSIALCGLASVTMAAGDEAGARALIEEALLFCSGVGFVGVDNLCGALALLLVNAGEPERALRVIGAVAAGAENEAGFAASMTDPSGALRAATREARKRLGDPPPGDPATVDLAAVLQAALGPRR